MNKQEAQSAIKTLQTELTSLSPSTIIHLFELDLTLIAEELGVVLPPGEEIFRFHNQIKLITSSIFWKGNEYIGIPINVTGFEVTSAGVLPTPKLTIAVNEGGITALALLKNKIRPLNDFVGCKLTRKRTLAKFLDVKNFDANNAPFQLETNELVEFPPDIYFINRKSHEDKMSVEYELVSVLDLEGLKLPKRQMIARRCNFSYRGEGCLYEYRERLNTDIHGEFAILPLLAPPVATEDDELIKDKLGITNLTDVGQYTLGQTYLKGQFVHIIQQGIKYYFVAKRDGILSPPPYGIDWIADKCSKCIKGCKIRWNSQTDKTIKGSVTLGSSDLIPGELPFGGFPSTSRF